MTKKVVELGKPQKFPMQEEIAQRIRDVFKEYDTEISTAAAIGILEILKHEFLS